MLEILISPGRHFLRPSNNINVVLVLGCEESGKMNFCGASQCIGELKMSSKVAPVVDLEADVLDLVLTFWTWDAAEPLEH